jgi:CRISPR-associated endonuclease Cas1
MAADRIHVASGYGLKLYVNRGHLVVHDGIGRQRRTVRFNRATSRLRRLVVLGHSGYVTLEALRWLRDVGAAFVHIDRDAKLVACTTGQGRDDARLRRAQALAATNGVGLELVRELIQLKLHGQAAVVAALPDSDAATAPRSAIDQGLGELRNAGTLPELRLVEAQAAREYFTAWGQAPVRFARADQQRVPEHWRSFGGRVSPITSANRLAANPANAILNYLFALIEAEASLACHAVGLDPGIGLLHADQKARDSLALDLMEPIRPEAEHYLLDLLTHNTFRARDFNETRTGNCRLQPSLTHRLAETLTTWTTLIAPVAETVARRLAHASNIASPPSPLTQTNRRQNRKSTGSPKNRQPTPRALQLGTCKRCGAETTTAGRAHCDACLPAFRVEQQADFSAAGPRALARLREAGADPAHGSAARERRAETMRQHHHQASQDQEQGDPDLFAREILSAIQEVPLRRLAAATGLSLRYVALIRRGERVPHPRHWVRLRNAVENLLVERAVGVGDDVAEHAVHVGAVDVAVVRPVGVGAAPFVDVLAVDDDEVVA